MIVEQILPRYQTEITSVPQEFKKKTILLCAVAANAQDLRIGLELAGVSQTRDLLVSNTNQRKSSVLLLSSLGSITFRACVARSLSDLCAPSFHHGPLPKMELMPPARTGYSQTGLIAYTPVSRVAAILCLHAKVVASADPAHNCVRAGREEAAWLHYPDDWADALKGPQDRR